MSRELLGVDIGGTNIKVGRVKNGQIDKNNQVGVNTQAKAEDTINDLLNCVDELISSDTEGIGVGVPAVVDPLIGIAYDVQNIPAWTKIALKDILQKRYNLPVFINNDANCFAFGEKIFGKGRSHNDFVGLSIGTGLGMGIVINNQLYNGVLCGAGEVGMVPYKDGIIEDYVGSFFFNKYYNESAKSLSEKAKNGDTLAIKAFHEFGLHLGEAIKIVLFMLAPETIILGGSISKAFPLFEQAIATSLQSFAYQKQIENLKIETSNLAGSAILGAAALCYQSNTEFIRSRAETK